ncbi:MAG: methionine biosynthesis protein MetW [Sphingomonadaceae bacterium]
MSSLPSQLQHVAALIPAGATVLDVGCADGLLLRHLRDTKGVDGRGLEIDPRLVSEAVSHGLSVVQGDADSDLADFPSDSVDYAVLSGTLQATRAPARVLSELLRIGQRAIIAFPNFGHWRVRLDLLLSGRMPATASLPDSWFETANIHLCTVNDFRALASSLGYRIDRVIHLSGDRPVTRHPNLLADYAIFLLGKG